MLTLHLVLPLLLLLLLITTAAAASRREQPSSSSLAPAAHHRLRQRSKVGHYTTVNGTQHSIP
jgi:hypothetical protein